MAHRLHHSGTARILVAHRLATDVSPAPGSPAHQRRRAPNDSRRDPGNANCWKTASAMARPPEVASNLGNDHLQGPYRSRLVLHHGLDSYLPVRKRHFNQERPARRVGSLSRCGPGQFLRRRRFWLLDSARLVARCRAKSAGCLWRRRRSAAHPHHLHREPLPDHAAFRPRHVSYASFSTIANVLPTDLYHSDAVASVSGLSGTGAGIGTIIAFELIGHLSDARQASAVHSFDPIVIAAGLIPFVGMILVLLLVRNTRATDQGLVRRI